jgi:hypothetical protein
VLSHYVHWFCGLRIGDGFGFGQMAADQVDDNWDWIALVSGVLYESFVG